MCAEKVTDSALFIGIGHYSQLYEQVCSVPTEFLLQSNTKLPDNLAGSYSSKNPFSGPKCLQLILLSHLVSKVAPQLKSYFLQHHPSELDEDYESDTAILPGRSSKIHNLVPHKKVFDLASPSFIEFLNCNMFIFLPPFVLRLICIQAHTPAVGEVSKPPF